MDGKNFLNQHECEAVVFPCMDFRFPKDLYRYLEEELKLSTDWPALAGGVKNLVDEGPAREIVLNNFRISKKFHKSRKIVLINHIDCAAYGGSKAFKSREEEIEFHKDQLYRAKNLIKAEKDLVDMEIILLFVNEKSGKPEYLEF